MATFTNQATLSYRGGTVNSNVVTGQIIEVLSATKYALVDTYGNRDTITYIVSIQNAGSTAVTGASVTDNLGAYPFGATTLVPLDYVDGSLAYYVDGVLQPTPTVVGSPELTVSNLTVPAGGNAMIVYQTVTNEFAPPTLGGTVTNTATVNGGGETFEASETITTESAPSLTIDKSLCPCTVTENGQITYTFTIRNFGNTAAVATDDIVVSDLFDPALSGITVTYNGTVLVASTDYTYDEATGQFATVAGVITVPAATYAQDAVTGEWLVTPGVSTLVVTGTV